MPVSSTLPPYDDMREYVLDAGKECDCCKMRDKCKGIVVLPNGETLFPACSYKDFSELLTERLIRKVYKEDHAL